MSKPGAVPDGPVRPVAPAVARYAGLVGAVLLTVAGWLGGSLPDAPLRTSLAGLWHARYGPWTLGCWLVGTLLLVGAWWSLRWGAPSARWAYLTAGLWSLPLLFAPPLGSRDVYSYVCQGWSWTHGVSPYQVGVAAAGCPWTDAVSPIWRGTPAPYGPFFVLLAGLAVLAGGGLVGALVLLRVVAVAGLLLAALCLPGLARAVGVPTRRAAWLVLACPLVGVHLVAGAHNDAVGLGLVLCGLLVLVRKPGRPRALVVAGVLLGLAVAVKAVAVVVLPFAALAAVLGRYTWRALLREAGWLAGAVLATLLVISVATGLRLGWVEGLAHSGDSQQWTSPPTAVGFVVDYVGALAGRRPHAVPVVRMVALVLLAALLVALWWWAWTSLRRLNEVRERVVRLAAARPRVALAGAGLALAATVLLAPVFHPWYVVWPLALLAVATRSPARTVWFVAPGAVTALLVLPDGTNLARFTKAPGAILMTALVVVLVVRAIRARRVR